MPRPFNVRKRSIAPRYARYAPYAAALGKMALRAAANRMFSSRTQTGPQAQVHTNTITGQHDVKTVYRRKRMPKRRKRRWGKFVKKVNAVINRGLGSTLQVLNDSNLALNTAVDVQGVWSIELYGVVSPTTTFGNNDLQRIRAAAGSGWTDQFKVRFESAVLDITIANVGTVTCELDAYEYYYVRDDTMFPNLGSRMADMLSESPNIGAQLLITTTGFTPFQCPGLGGWIRITKKTKYFVPAGSQITYQKRDARNRMFSTNDFELTIMKKRYMTNGVLFIQKGVPTAANGAGGTQLSAGCTRTYNWKVQAVSINGDGVA